MSITLKTLQLHLTHNINRRKPRKYVTYTSPIKVKCTHAELRIALSVPPPFWPTYVLCQSLVNMWTEELPLTFPSLLCSQVFTSWIIWVFFFFLLFELYVWLLSYYCTCTVLLVQVNKGPDLKQHLVLSVVLKLSLNSVPHVKRNSFPSS